MSDADLLADPEQLAEDAKVLDAWANCGGARLEIARRAAAALREVADMRANGLIIAAQQKADPDLTARAA